MQYQNNQNIPEKKGDENISIFSPTILSERRYFYTDSREILD